MAIKNDHSSSDFLEFLIGNFSWSIGKNGGVLPLGMGPNFGPKNSLKRNTGILMKMTKIKIYSIAI